MRRRGSLRRALAVAVAGSLLIVGCGRSSSPSGTGYPPIDGIPCETGERVAFHIHAHLAVYAHGRAQTVPYGIGIGRPWRVPQSSEGPFASGGSCFYWLHTHTKDGVIHIEAPQPRTFTLADFFAIWGQPLGPDQVGENRGPVTAYLDGERVAGDPGQIELREHALIQLDVGDATPPQPFVFPPGL